MPSCSRVLPVWVEFSKLLRVGTEADSNRIFSDERKEVAQKSHISLFGSLIDIFIIVKYFLKYFKK